MSTATLSARHGSVQRHREEQLFYPFDKSGWCARLKPGEKDGLWAMGLLIKLAIEGGRPAQAEMIARGSKFNATELLAMVTHFPKRCDWVDGDVFALYQLAMLAESKQKPAA